MHLYENLGRLVSLYENLGVFRVYLRMFMAYLEHLGSSLCISMKTWDILGRLGAHLGVLGRLYEILGYHFVRLGASL